MKYLIFFSFCAFALPVMTWGAYASSRARGWLMAALVFSTCLGPYSSIHLVTVEKYRGTEDGVIFFLTDVICLALMAGMALRHPARIRWLPYNAWWLIALFGLSCISAAQASTPQFASFALLTFMKAYAIYWCTYNCLALGTSPMYLWYGFIAAGGVLGTVAVKQFFISHVGRASALFPHSNTVPSYAFLFLPVLLLWGLCGPGLSAVKRAVTVAVCVGMSLAIILTMSRAGILMMGFVVLVSLWLAWKRAPTAQLRLMCGVVGGLMLLAALVLSAKVAHRFATAPPASGEAREEFNRAARTMATNHSLGVGPNNFSYVLSTEPQYRSMLFILRYEAASGVCHNIYYLTASELGWGGLLLFLITLGRFAGNAVSAALRSRRFEGLVLYGICLGWFAVLAIGWLEWVMRQAYVMDMYAITAAFSVCVAEAARRQAREESQPTPRARASVTTPEQPLPAFAARS